MPLSSRHLMANAILTGGLALWPFASANAVSYLASTEVAALYESIDISVQLPEEPAAPFDTDVPVFMVHSSTREIIRSHAYYDGRGQWVARMTPTQVGTWFWRVDKPEDGLSWYFRMPLRFGVMTVEPSANPDIKGFLTHQNARFALPDYKGQLRYHPFMVFMDYGQFPPHDPITPSETTLYRFEDPAYFSSYLEAARNHGSSTVFLSVGEPEMWFEGLGNAMQPNLRTFELLETLIKSAHQAGMRVHIWKWKDEQRGAVPSKLPGGVNGEVDRRLQRYIADRLGPLPGWSMGLGFDLHEWAEPEEIDDWARYLQQRSGWDHLLTARGHRIAEDVPQTVLSYDGFGRSVELTTSAFGPGSPQEIVEDIRLYPDRPHLYEERHTYQRPGFKLDQDGTRKLLWWSEMAGGMGSWIGYFKAGMKAYQGGPYPSPEEFRIWREFWQDWGQLDMQPCNAGAVDAATPGVAVLTGVPAVPVVALSGPALQNTAAATRSMVLCGSDGYRIVYAEGAQFIPLDLTAAQAPVPVSALDTKSGVRVDLGFRDASYNLYEAPHVSDWVISIGAP